MKASRFKVFALIFIVVVLFGLGISVGARRWPQSPGAQQDNQLKPTDTLPPVTSKIKGLEVLSAFIDGDGLVNITVINKTGKTIVGLGISTGNRTYTDDNVLTQDNPKPLILPYASYTLTRLVSNFRSNQPIHVSVALYDDATEEGDEAQLKNIHTERERQKTKRSHEFKNK
jgi:hypothetical protein